MSAVEPVIKHVSDTAFLVAHYRAAESARTDALFHDPLAERLAGEKGRAVASTFVSGAVTSWMVTVRTVVIDDFILSMIESGIDTVVNLGAGLDARPYRLDLPADVTWIEADYPDVIALKESLLSQEIPQCSLERVGVDLGDDTARRGFLADLEARGGNVLVLTEGVVPYLDNDQVAALAADLRALRHVRYWIVEYFVPQVHEWRERRGVTRQMAQAPFKFKPKDWFAFFARHGWRPSEIRYLPEEGTRLRRPFPVPIRARMIGSIVRWFLPRASRGSMGQMIGYALLEPSTPSLATPSGRRATDT
jgi:methyltransferase (TIGR00027 family)